MGVAGTIFELRPPDFGKILIFSKCSNDSKTMFWYFQQYKKCQKSFSLSIQLIPRSTASIAFINIEGPLPPSSVGPVLTLSYTIKTFLGEACGPYGHDIHLREICAAWKRPPVTEMTRQEYESWLRVEQQVCTYLWLLYFLMTLELLSDVTVTS